MQAASDQTCQAPKLEVEVAMCHSTYDKISPKATNTAVEKHTMMVTAEPWNPGATMSLVVK